MYRYIHLTETDSTNTYLKNLADAGLVCVIADRQTGGRGRKGRTFESPAGGLYMSFTCAPASVDHLTAKAAVCVARATEKLTGLTLGIKWVNDLMADGKKLCGILCEGVWTDGVLTSAIVGIGVNLYGELPEYLGDIATTVESAGGTIPDRDALARAIIGEFESCTDFYEEYRRRQNLLGCAVRVHRGDDVFDAVFEDVDESFGAVLRLENGERAVLTSGEVSLRKCTDQS